MVGKENTPKQWQRRCKRSACLVDEAADVHSPSQFLPIGADYLSFTFCHYEYAETKGNPFDNSQLSLHFFLIFICFQSSLPMRPIVNRSCQKGSLLSGTKTGSEAAISTIKTHLCMKIGYARVSTHEQNLNLQVDALRQAGCEKVFTDEGVSGATASRPALDKVLMTLQPGDRLITWKLDRLGRSLVHLIWLIGNLDERGVGFRSLSECIDTTTAGGRLYFHMMGALAEFERALIGERTRAGMEAARRRGVAIGRPAKLNSTQVALAKRELAAGTASLSSLAVRFDVAPLTLSRALMREASSDLG